MNNIQINIQPDSCYVLKDSTTNRYIKFDDGRIRLSTDKLSGFAIKAKIKGDPVLYSAYPFRGHFDGGNHTITGLKIGSKTDAAHLLTRKRLIMSFIRPRMAFRLRKVRLVM